MYNYQMNKYLQRIQKNLLLKYNKKKSKKNKQKKGKKIVILIIIFRLNLKTLKKLEKENFINKDQHIL